MLAESLGMSLLRTLTPEKLASAQVGESKLPHVLLVLDQFPKTLGGGERIVLRLAALLPQYGYRASILTFSIHPQSPVLESPPCPIYLLPLERTYDLTAMRAALELRRFLRSNRVRIVHTFFESSDIWAGFVTRIASKAKLVWSRRDMGILRSRKHHIAYRIMSRVPNAVLAVSEQVRQHCIEVDRISPSRVTSVYNGLDLSNWNDPSKSNRSTSKVLITTVGNIRRVKGHDLLIKAAASVVHQFPDANFSIAGEVLEPEYFEELQTLIRDLGLSNHFTFAGGVTNLQELLCAADVFVLPSRSEGFSNAIVEAMAASLPVIATDVGGNAEAVEHEVTGMIIPPEDPDALAAAICRMLAHPDLGRQMGAAGKESVAEKFTTSAMMTGITGVYAKLLTTGPQGGDRAPAVLA